MCADADACSILLVEDDPETRAMLAMFLELEGYRVTQAKNGREALHVLRDELPCAMVVDLMMPEMDGMELRRQQQRRAAMQNVPFIVVSAVVNGQAIANQLHADDFLAKPVDGDALLTAVRRFCQPELASGASPA
jgi:DNA-binding response OmpR family regulator